MTAQTATAALEAVGLAGPSPATANLAAALDGAAQAQGVLVVGEAGSCHVLAARALHILTRPATSPFQAQSCTDEPGKLERQIFGSDARRARTLDGRTPSPERVTEDSLIWRTQGGTLFLDGIDELPEPLQARLAHLLRDREVVVAGSERRMPLDLRVIGGTRSGIEREVDAGRLRPDLFHRLPARVALVPLRERPQDIPAIASFWIAAVCRRTGVAPKRLEQPAEVLLAAFPWRRNLSELRSLIELLVSQVSSDTIRLENVIATIPLSETSFPQQTPGTRPQTLREAKRDFERQFISSVLATHHGRIPEAARALGIQRTNLYRKLRALRIGAASAHSRHSAETHVTQSAFAPETTPW